MTGNKRPTGEEFEKVTTPVINKCYHVSWAYRGAYFQLLEIKDDKAIVQAPKNKNKKPLTVNISDLREIRKRESNQ